MPSVKLSTGETLNFPEGTTDDQIHGAVEEYIGQQSKLQPSQPKSESFQEANKRRFGELAQGAMQGLGNALIGGVQAATDVGEGAAKGIEKMIYGDTMNQQTFGNRLADRVKALKEQQSQLPTTQRVGISIGEMAPYLAVGNKLGAVKGAAAAGGVSSLLSPQEESGLGNRLIEGAKGTAAGAAGGAILKGAAETAPLLTSAIGGLAKKGLQKAFGVKPEAVQAFKDLGIDPTLADVSNSAGLQNFVKDIPIAGKPITQALQKQVNQISSQIQDVAGSQRGTYGQAGKEIIKGAENIVEKSKLRDQQLYGKVNQFIPAETPVSLNNTFKALQDRKVQITGEVSGGKVAGYNKFITNIQNELAQGKQVPYDSLTALRSEVGSALQGKLEPQERSALNKIYSGLTSDIKENIMKSDLDKIGKQSALQAWEKANNSHRLRTQFIQENIQPLLDKGTPEEVYRYATSQVKLGGTKVGQIMRSLNEEQKNYVRGTLVRDLGLAQKGAQGAEAETFSPAKFLAEYSQLKKNGTDKTIFTPEQRASFNKLNKLVELTKNTEQAGQQKQLLQAIGLTSIAVPTHGVGLIPAIGGARISANLMANPQFVNWLATTSKSTPKELPKYINKLSRIAATNPEIREEVLQYISGFGVNDSNAEEPNMSENEIRQQLITQQQNQPFLMQGINPDQEAKKIKNRYYK